MAGSPDALQLHMSRVMELGERIYENMPEDLKAGLLIDLEMMPCITMCLVQARLEVPVGETQTEQLIPGDWVNVVNEDILPGTYSLGIAGNLQSPIFFQTHEM